MKYLLIQEITDWDAPNHIYIVNQNKSRLFGYVPERTTAPIMFKKAMSFDSRSRTFKKISEIS